MSAAFVLIHSLGWALLHSLWQGALIFSGTALLFFLFRNNANARYYSAYVSLMALLLCLVVNFVQEWQRMQIPVIKVTEAFAGTYREYYIKAEPAGQPVIGLPLIRRLEAWFPYIIPGYLAGICLLSIRFLLQLLHVRLYRIKYVVQPPEQLSLLFGTLQQQLGIRSKAMLLLSEKVTVPMVFGLLKPVVLLPVAAVNRMSTDQLEAILLHELAHIRRDDYFLTCFNLWRKPYCSSIRLPGCCPGWCAGNASIAATIWS